MSKASVREKVRSALERAGSGWIFRYWGNDAEKNLDKVTADLDRFAREYHRRFGERPDPLTLVEENPWKGAVFFQIDTLLLSTEMKIMIWRLLLGCEITRVDFKYRAGREWSLSVALRTPYGGDEEVYAGQQPSDFRVLRHLGVTGVGDQVYLQGYYLAKGL
jgi:hypothetical protein